MQVREKHKTIKSKTGNLHSNSPDPTVQNPQNRKIFQCHILERYVSINFSGKTIVLLIYLKIKFELDIKNEKYRSSRQSSVFSSLVCHFDSLTKAQTSS